MKAIRWLTLFALVALLLAPAVAFAQDPADAAATPPSGRHSAAIMDAHGDGVCDNFIDEDGDGVCDNCQGGGACAGQAMMQGQGMMARGRAMMHGMMQGRGMMQGHNMMRGQGMMQGQGRMQGQGAMQGQGPGFEDADGDGVCDHYSEMHPETAPSGN